MSASGEQGLGSLQRRILVWLYEQTLAAEKVAAFPGRLAVWGVPWQTHVRGSEWSPGKRASVSAALRRLEARGLLLRQNESGGSPRTGPARIHAAEPHSRTTSVLLTEEGRRVAKQLTFVTAQVRLGGRDGVVWPVDGSVSGSGT